MSVLSNRGIISAVGHNEMAIEPYFPGEKLQAASYDLELHPNIMALPTTFDMSNANERYGRVVDFRSGKDEVDDLFTRISMDKDGMVKHLFPSGAEFFSKRFVIEPGQCVLGLTSEVVTLGDALLGRLEGRSGVGSALPGDPHDGRLHRPWLAGPHHPGDNQLGALRDRAVPRDAHRPALGRAAGHAGKPPVTETRRCIPGTRRRSRPSPRTGPCRPGFTRSTQRCPLRE